MMDFDLIENELIKVFKVSKDEIYYFGRNIQSKLLEYSIKIDSFTPELNTRWSCSFGAGSYFSISKEPNQTKLTLIITISERDYSEFFHLKHSEIKMDNLGIIQNMEAFKN